MYSLTSPSRPVTPKWVAQNIHFSVASKRVNKVSVNLKSADLFEDDTKLVLSLK